jgi:hypothetical protein
MNDKQPWLVFVIEATAARGAMVLPGARVPLEEEVVTVPLAAMDEVAVKLVQKHGSPGGLVFVTDGDLFKVGDRLPSLPSLRAWSCTFQTATSQLEQSQVTCRPEYAALIGGMLWATASN